MVATVLVRAVLTPDMVAGGRNLLAALDAEGTVFEAAFWLFDDEIGEWQLHLASRRLRVEGPRTLYHQVNLMLAKLRLGHVLPIEMVSITDQRSKWVQILTGALGTTTSVDGARLDNAIIGGMRVPGCLLYRLTTKQKLTATP